MAMKSQAQIFRNLSAVLEKAGSNLDKVIKVNVFLANMEDFAAMNETYGKFLDKEPKPVRNPILDPENTTHDGFQQR